MQSIKSGIYYEDSFLGVTLGALVFSHGTILIDAPLRPEDARSWRSALLNQRGGTNRLLISLDSHLDRTLGARALECTIIAHQKTALVYRNRPMVFKGQSLESGSEWESFNEAIGIRWAPPDITFSQNMTLHWGGPAISLEHHPGPAPGAIWVSLPEEGVVYIGDTVVENQPPFLANADLDIWQGSLEVLQKEYRNFILVGGRNGLISSQAIRDQSRFLKKVEKKLDRLSEKGASPEATEDLIPGLLTEFNYPAEEEEKFTQRLLTGLYQYFNRHYCSSQVDEILELEEDVDEGSRPG